MDMLSPLSRRIIAVALLALAIITALNVAIVPLWQWTAQSLQDLDTARDREARMIAAISTKPPELGKPVPANLLLTANDRNAALTTLTSIISAAAAEQKVKLENVGAGSASGDEHRVVVELSATGSEVALVALLSSVEARSTAVRFESWTITAPDVIDMPARLQARAVAIWAVRP